MKKLSSGTGCSYVPGVDFVIKFFVVKYLSLFELHVNISHYFSTVKHLMNTSGQKKPVMCESDSPTGDFVPTTVQ